jgi:hypothetical protein
VSNEDFASKERGREPNDDEAAGAAVFGMCRVVALAGGGTAAGTRRLADGAFVLALLGNNNAVAASASQPYGYVRRHKSVEAAGVASGARQVAAAARDGSAAGSKCPAVDRPNGDARCHKSVKAAGAAFGAHQVAATAWDEPAAGTKRPAMKAAKTSEGGVVPLKIIGAPPPRVSAAQRAGSVDLGMSRYQVSSNAKEAPRRNECQGASQADTGAGVELTEVVTH